MKNISFFFWRLRDDHWTRVTYFRYQFLHIFGRKKKKTNKIFFPPPSPSVAPLKLVSCRYCFNKQPAQDIFFLVLATFSLKRGPSMSASDKRPLFFFSSLPPPVCVFASVGLFNGPSEKLILHQSFRWLFRGKKNKYQNRTRWSGQLIGRVFATSPTGGTCGN